MKKTNIFISGVLLIMICSCSSNHEKISEKSSFAQLLHRYNESRLQLDPITATTAGDYRYNDKFPNTLSKAFKDHEKEVYESYKQELLKFDRAGLSKEDQISYDILLWECNNVLEGLAFPIELMPVDQMWSPNLTIGQLASGKSSQPFKTVKDYEDWLKRVDEYLIWCDTAIANMRKGMEKGVVLPKSLIKKTIPQFADLTRQATEDHLFYRPVALMPESISEPDKKRLSQAYADMVENKLIPMYKKIATFLQEEYLPAGRPSSGVNAFDFGKDYYAYQIKRFTTTDLTAKEIHQLGLQEVERIRKEMEKVKDEVGYKGDLRSFFDFIRTNKKLMPYTEPQQVIDNFHAIYNRMLPQLDLLFSLKPVTKFEIRRTERFREQSASAEYAPGSLDGKRPGIFYVPIPDVKAYNVYADEDLFLHEAIPGHHYQISLQQENDSLPEFRRTLWYSAYGEGWALYAESLGKTLGLYTDPYQYFGMLGFAMHRAIRLVVDTGIHAMGWTREQAIDYSLENEAEPKNKIIPEIERYMAMPGQALSYKVGQLKILELRDKAQETLGDDFDIKEFHRVVLESGCMPLSILEDRVNTWIDEHKKA